MAEALDPNEVCEVCSETRENHGDKQHKFSRDGILIPVEKGQPARKEPPKERSSSLGVEAERVLRDPVTSMSLRMIERLVAKELLNGDDLLFIFGGKP